MHDGGVRQMELWPVVQHETDRVAAFDTQPRQPGGDLPHPIGVLTPGEGHLVADRPDGHRLRL
jgi:hypothetical protein